MNGTRTRANHSVWVNRVLLVLGVTVATSSFAQAYAAMSDESAADAKLSTRQVQQHAGGAGIDHRIKLLAAELSLDPGQQAAVRRLLLQQREQTLKVWRNDAVPSAVRIKATHGIADRTAEQIRALLNDEQRSRYIQPRNREAEQNLASGDVESWMAGRAPTGSVAAHE